VDEGKEDPFHYSSGNFGPGYVDVKGTVAVQRVFKPLVKQLAVRLVDGEVEFDHIAGNVTGGVCPAYQLREDYQEMTGRDDIEYVYVRGARKQGGHGEQVTGVQHLPKTNNDGSPSRLLVVEELVNFAETTVNSAVLLRSLGFTANQGATILHYNHNAANTSLEENDVAETYLTTLSSLLDAAVVLGRFPEELVNNYRAFLRSPADWMKVRGLVNVPHTKG
jgi:orotate phosphoribosyltransferase